MSHACHRLIAWIAILAMLSTAMVPGLARSHVAMPDGAPWADICTTAPATSAGSMPAPDGGTHAQGGGHCPWCANHAGGFALPDTGIFQPRFENSASRHQSPAAEHWRVQAIVVLPPARAPPTVS